MAPSPDRRGSKNKRWPIATNTGSGAFFDGRGPISRLASLATGGSAAWVATTNEKIAASMLPAQSSEYRFVLFNSRIPSPLSCVETRYLEKLKLVSTTSF